MKPDEIRSMEFPNSKQQPMTPVVRYYEFMCGVLKEFTAQIAETKEQLIELNQKISKVLVTERERQDRDNRLLKKDKEAGL